MAAKRVIGRLDHLDDTNISSPQTNQALVFSSGKWANVTLSLGSTGASGTTGTPGAVAFYGVTNLLSEDVAHIFWDIVNRRMAIGAGVANSTLQVSGSLSLLYRVVSTGSYTLTEKDNVILVTTSGASALINLPTAVDIGGRVYTIKKANTTEFNVLIDAFGSQTIDGEETLTISAPYETIRIISDNSNWWIL